MSEKEGEAQRERAGGVEKEKEKEKDEEKRYAAAMRETGAQLNLDQGIRIAGWNIRTHNGSILNSYNAEEWQKILGSTHLPVMVFGNNTLELVHEPSNVKIHFNALDALRGWKREALPPVEVPAAAQWKFHSKPSDQLILDYDYTYTTPYCGSEMFEMDHRHNHIGRTKETLEWVECEENIDLIALQARDPILFYKEMVLYEDELDDNGISLLSVKVRVMPGFWFLLLRFWLRVDGVLMRLRDTRMYAPFGRTNGSLPLIIRERCKKEDTFQALALRGFSSDPVANSDPNLVSSRLQSIEEHCEKLSIKVGEA